MICIYQSKLYVFTQNSNLSNYAKTDKLLFNWVHLENIKYNEISLIKTASQPLYVKKIMNTISTRK